MTAYQRGLESFQSSSDTGKLQYICGETAFHKNAKLGVPKIVTLIILKQKLFVYNSAMSQKMKMEWQTE